MTLASISPFIVLHADRSALLDAKNEVLYLALWRLLSRFELPLSECLKLLAGTNKRLADLSQLAHQLSDKTRKND